MGHLGYQPSSACPQCGYQADPGRCTECGGVFSAKDAQFEAIFQFWNRLAGYAIVGVGFVYVLIFAQLVTIPPRTSACGPRRAAPSRTVQASNIGLPSEGAAQESEE